MEREGKTEALKREEEARRREERDIQTAIGTVLKTQAGQKLFKFMHNRAGQAKPDIALDPSGIPAKDSMLYNSGRRSLYGDIRERAPLDLLMAVEMAAEAEQRGVELTPEAKAKFTKPKKSKRK